MAALVLVLMVPVLMGMLMGVHPCLVAMLMPVVGVGASLMAVFMLMLVFIVAAHAASPPFKSLDIF
jgi:hypothetical protein